MKLPVGRTLMPRVLLYALLAGYTGLIALPIVWMVLSSLKTKREIFASPFDLPTQPQWGNFTEAWQRGMSAFFLNSLFVTSGSVALIVLVSGLAAYGLARLRFPGRVPLYLLIITGYAIPIHTVLVPLYISLNGFNLVNTYVGLIGPYVAFGIPFSVLLLYAFFIEFPQDLEDAARLDGCGIWSMVFRVVLPVSGPALTSVAIFQGVFLWNEFLLALIIISDPALKTLPLGLVAFQGEWATNWPVLLAALTLATVPLLLMFMLLQRQFINSLTGFSK